MEREQEAARREAAAPATSPATTDPNEAAAPEAVRAAALMRSDSDDLVLAVRGRGVEWVRPSDLLARHAASWSGRGIDFQAELARRARAPMSIRHQVGDRAHRLPPLTAFGRGSPTHTTAVRSGVGMS